MGPYFRVHRRVGALRTTLRSATVLLALVVAVSAFAGWGPFDGGHVTELAVGTTLPSAPAPLPADGGHAMDSTVGSTLESVPADGGRATGARTNAPSGATTQTTTAKANPTTDPNSAVGSPTSTASSPIVAPTGRPSETLLLVPPGPGCVNGWTTPSAGTPRRQEPLDVIRDTMGITGQFNVAEMRYFTGPETSSDSLAPGQTFVEHWYVKAALVDDPSFRARWMVTKRTGTEAVVAAVAPYETSGFRSPDWRAFDGVDGAPGDGTRYAVPGVPGLWSGGEYDFVTGQPGFDRGLPPENEGCLVGT